MKALFYAPYALWAPHLETDLELVRKHLDAGDEVHVVVCSASLAICEPNPGHLKSLCEICVSRRSNGLKSAGLARAFWSELPAPSREDYATVPKFASLAELKAYVVDGADIGMGVASSLITRLRERAPDLQAERELVEREVASATAVFRYFQRLCKQVRPDVFYLFNGRFGVIRPAMRAVQQAGIKLYVHERAGRVDRYDLIEDTFPHDVDYRLKEIRRFWEESTHSLDERRSIAEQWFRERRGGVEQSWFSYTKDQKRGSLPEGFDPAKCNIAVYNTSEDETEAVGNWSSPLFESQARALRGILDAADPKRTHLYLRIHPNLVGVDNSQMRGVRELRADWLTVIPAEAPIDSYALMDACNKVVTFGSTMGVEAAFWERPSILLRRSPYESACYVPKSVEELARLILDELPARGHDVALQFGYWQQSTGHSFKYFVPEGLFGGKFLGKPVRASIGARIKARILKTLGD